MSPTLSIICASYKQGRFVGKSIEALSKQTYQDFELIVVDRFSNDGTREIVQSLPQARFIEKDMSSSEAYLYAVGLARGKYIMISTTSDYLYSATWLMDAVDHLDQNDHLSLVWTSAVDIDENDKLIGVWASHYLHRPPPEGRGYLGYWLFDHYLPELNYVVDRRVFNICISNNSELSLQKLDFLRKLLFNFTRFGYLQSYIPSLGHAGRSHGGQLTSQNVSIDRRAERTLRKLKYIYLLKIIVGIETHHFQSRDGVRFNCLSKFAALGHVMKAAGYYFRRMLRRAFQLCTRKL